ncbi:MAG: hypothetical protein M3N34_09920 [Pseudomonadota bacterium]|nr:hypothetical protein [Pseudomonadota bacterium]
MVMMVSAALAGAKLAGFSIKLQPGQGLWNTYEISREGTTQIASVRTSRDRYISFPPLDQGRRWETLDDADVVLVSAVDDHLNPQNIDVYLFPADEVRKRFDANYAARIANARPVPDNHGLWVPIDKGDDAVIDHVGHSLAIDYPAIARFAIDELEAVGNIEPETKHLAVGVPSFKTASDVLVFARAQIAAITGMPIERLKLDLRLDV